MLSFKNGVILAVVTLQAFYLGKLDFLNVTDSSLSNLPRESEKQTSLANKSQ